MCIVLATAGARVHTGSQFVAAASYTCCDRSLTAAAMSPPQSQQQVFSSSNVNLLSCSNQTQECCAIGARVQMRVYEPADKLLLTIDPLLNLSKVRSHIKHTITLLDPVAGQLPAL